MIGPASIEPYLSRVPDERRTGLCGEGGKGSAQDRAGQGRAGQDTARLKYQRRAHGRFSVDEGRTWMSGCS